jgi:16S rRNA (guanine966-N2)-methyltransferase
MIANAGPFGRVLDLYAGSGALGLEALSRGARSATFMEADLRACASIKRNYEATRLPQPVEIIAGTIPAALRRLHEPFDLILSDPPYTDLASDQVIGWLEAQHVLAERALIVLEHAATITLPVEIVGYTQWKHRRYGDSALTMYRKAEGGENVEQPGVDP